jgi:carboxylesterase
MSNVLHAHPDHRAFDIGEGSTRALLIHGFLGSPRDMRPLAAALAAAGVATRGVLLPGFGPDTARQGAVRAEEWLGAAREAWADLRRDAERTTLVGFSMGGAVALTIAAEAGFAPDQLVLVAPHWKFADRRTVFLPIGRHFIRQIKPFGPIDPNDPRVRRTVAEMAPQVDLDDPEIQREVRESANVSTHALNELRRVNIGAARVSQVDAPVTILQGLQDTVTLPAYSRQLATRLGAALHEIPGDHLLVDPRCDSYATVRDVLIRLASGQPPQRR